jgi:hypothetical protein
LAHRSGAPGSIGGPNQRDQGGRPDRTGLMQLMQGARTLGIDGARVGGWRGGEPPRYQRWPGDRWPPGGGRNPCASSLA